MGRPAGAPNRPDRAAYKILTDKQFTKQLKDFDTKQMDVLNGMARGRGRQRHAGAILAAIRMKLEWGHAKPAQEHELSGSVTIQVVSPLMGAPGSARRLPQHVVETPIEKEASLGQGPIMGRFVANDATTQDVVVEADRLGPPEPRLTSEDRRAAARDEWLRDQAAMRGERP